ncbi:unnamed protein product [Ixodes persulcatus]
MEYKCISLIPLFTISFQLQRGLLPSHRGGGGGVPYAASALPLWFPISATKTTPRRS